MFRKITALLLLILMVISIAACAQVRDGGEGGTTAADSGATVTAAETEMLYDANGYILDRLPQKIDFGGEQLTMLFWSDRQYQEFFANELNGENVNDAIFNRNLKVGERLNDTVRYVGEPGNASYYNSFAQKVIVDVDSGTGEYDIVAGYSLANASLTVKGYCADLMQYEDIFEFDYPWWPSKMVKEATIYNKLFFATGDISTNLILMLQATYFNKEMQNSLGLESPYELVKNGTWTLEKMMSMAKGVYQDFNGNGLSDEGDIYGFTLSSTSNAYDTAFYSCGLITMEKDNNDLPYISEKWNSEKTMDVLSKLLNFFYNTGDVYAAVGTKIFADGRCLFEFASLNAAFNSFVGLEFYGIVPPPKYDVYQESYITAVSTPHTLYSISIASQKKEHCAYLMECLASESYRSVTPEVFNVTLQSKYASDEDTGKMLDILRDSVIFEVGKVYSYAFNNLTFNIWRDCIKNNNPNFASSFKMQSKALQSYLEKFIAEITG
jgi:hypothetical protein